MRLLLLLLLCFTFTLSHVQADSPVLDYDAFGHLPILHDGRIKPMDTFARIYLYRLHGDQYINGTAANKWLAQSIFEPKRAAATPFIRIKNQPLAQSLELALEADKLYTFNEVLAAYQAKRELVVKLIQKGQENLTKHESDFIDLYSTINDYSNITRALTLALPSNQSVSEAYSNKLGLTGEETTYLDLLGIKEQVTADAKAAVKQHGSHLKKYSPMQQQAAMLAFYFAGTEATGEQNSLFRIIPAYLDNSREWYAPWALLKQGHGSPQGSELLGYWQALAEAYHQQDTASWSAAIEQIQAHTTNARHATDAQLTLEVWYHQLNLSLWVMIAYGLAFIVLLAGMFNNRIPTKPAIRFLWTGVLLHIIMISTRIMILERPPVSTLYESVIFVALIAVILGWRLDKHAEAREGKLIGSLLGAFLFAISGLFAEKGDSLGVLVAVLNTNFWLATHVVCITIGYGCAMVAGTMGHVYLINRSESVGKKLQVATLIALLFTAIGTILGGIWADQSWGRFWGWDPKENGALAIVIWLIWLLHGRITGHLNHITFAAFLCCTNIVVALSWFGVNLLSVGLHSYGFTDAAAYGLAAFCVGELALIIGLALRARKKATHA